MLFFAIDCPTVLAAETFDSRSFGEVYASLPNDVATFYKAPQVSERLKIQRGHFVLGRVSKENARITIPLSMETVSKASTWIKKRMDQRGTPGSPSPATSDIACFRVPSNSKSHLEIWLEQRSDLEHDYVYPTPWHEPHIGEFSASHGRKGRLPIQCRKA